MMAKTAAIELIRHKIRVNTIYPGWTDTPGERKFFTEDTLQKAGSFLPMGRLAKPEEIARGIVFLADPASEYMTGSLITIDGGGMLPWMEQARNGRLLIVSSQISPIGLNSHVVNLGRSC